MADDLDMDEEGEGTSAKGKKGKKEPKPKKEKPPKEPKPKKEKTPKEPKPEGSGEGLKKFLMFLLYLIIVGGIGAFLFFNVFGVRQKFVIPQLRRIPVPFIQRIIPTLEGEVVEIIDTSNPDAALSKKQLLDKIASLEKELEDLKTAGADRETYIGTLNQKVTELQIYENEQETFKKNKEQFDIMIGEGDPNAYMAYYEQMNPEIAAQIYKDAVVKKDIDENMQKYAATFQDMTAASAATVLEELIRTNVDLVVYIMENVSAKQRGAILSAMTARNAAVVTKRLIPQ